MAVVVARAQLLEEEVLAPAVGDDVVLRDHEHVFVRRCAQQLSGEQWAALEIEQSVRLSTHPSGGRHQRFAELQEVVLDEDDARSGRHELVRKPLDDRERRAQDLVAGDDVVQGLVERGPVQCSFQPERDRDVVHGAAAVELVDEPEPFLREREREELRAHRCPSSRSSPCEG